MAFSFSKPNKTSTFFSQVNAGRKQVAGQQNPQVQGAIGTVQNQTQAQKDASKQVVKAGNQMVASTNTGSLTSSGKLGEAENLSNTQVAGPGNFSQMAIDKGVQTDFRPQHVALNKYGVPEVQGPVLSRVTDSGNLATINTSENINSYMRPIDAQNATLQAQIDASIANANATRDTFGQSADSAIAAATADAQAAYQAQQAQKDAEAKRVSENNLGQLGLESADERAQAEKAALLAEKGSNAGKLAALYGVGYDVNKFGALDSNIMQGQLNEAQSNAQSALAGKEMARREAVSTREAYLNTNKGEVEKINAEKSRVDAKIAEIAPKLAAIKEQLAKVASDTSANGVAAKARLQEELRAQQKAQAELRKNFEAVKKREKELKDAEIKGEKARKEREKKKQEQRQRAKDSDAKTQKQRKNLAKALIAPNPVTMYNAASDLIGG